MLQFVTSVETFFQKEYAFFNNQETFILSLKNNFRNKSNTLVTNKFFHQKKKYRSFFGSNSKIKMNSNNFSGKDEQIKQDISGDSGVIKTIIKEGSGSLIQDGFQVKLNYEGKLENGRVFDSSLIKNKPFSFIVGDGKVISGWELGIKSMKIGEKAEFYISSKYGYKKKGIPPIIPPNADLFFEIEVLDAFEGENLGLKKNSGLLKNKISENFENFRNTDEPEKISSSEKFFFISPFSSQTGEQAPWWLNPNITFFLIFILIIILFATVYSLGGINNSFDNPSSILDLDE
jgi:FKBP-type peptidyl-prolyl cis-trans isomerase